MVNFVARLFWDFYKENLKKVAFDLVCIQDYNLNIIEASVTFNTHYCEHDPGLEI